jgi:hypothetical protein
MFEASPQQRRTGDGSSVHLEFGVDHDQCDQREVRICERGMAFKSRWCFELGTQLAVALSYPGGNSTAKQVNTEGVVVHCEKVGKDCYEINLLFVDLSDDFRKALKEELSGLDVGF